jgi:regulator of sigma E protease
MGIIAMIAGLTLLILVHEFGHWLVAQLLGFKTPVFSIGFGKPYIVVGRWRNTEFRLSPWLLGGYVALPEMGDETTVKEYMTQNGQDPTQYKHFAVWKRAAVAVAGVVMNVITALVLVFALFAAVGKPHYEAVNAYIGDFAPGTSIARDAGFQPKDVIVSIDGQPVKSGSDVVRLMAPHKGTPVTIEVQRAGEAATRSITVTPNADGRIGIALGETREAKFERMSVGTAAVESAKFNTDMVGKMISGLGMMVGLVETPKDLPAGATEVHGIVAIVQIGATAFDNGLFSFIMMLAIISLNLAVMNILPIPVLDGGHLMFLGIEKLMGRPINREIQARIMMFFMALLLMLMVFAVFNDIFNPIKMP